VKATEDILRILEGGDVGGRSLTSRLRQELGAVAELLQRDADLMETRRHVDRACGLDGRSDADSATTDARLQCPHPRLPRAVRAASLVVPFQIVGGSLEA
jgi:hypothetical protein